MRPSNDLQGTGYANFSNLLGPLDTLSLGICMDLNPLPTSIEWPAPCELASFALSRRSRVLVLLCAWLDSDQHPDDVKWDLTTVVYWRQRLLPLWSTDSPDLRPMPEYLAPSDHDETIVVICNRIGTERGMPVVRPPVLF
jgi:protein N-terminal amidase